VTSETVRQWCLTFGQTYANELRRRRPRCGDKWHLDEVMLTIRGQKHSLWRAVDQDGNVLDILVQSRRNKKAAQRFFRKLLQGLHYVPRVIITEKLRSSGAAKREILPGVEHRQHKRLGHPGRELPSAHATTREENAEVQIGPHRLNAFFLLIAPISGHFQARRHLMPAQEYRATLQKRFQVWSEVTGAKQVA
jgi:putative transposase